MRSDAQTTITVRPLKGRTEIERMIRENQGLIHFCISRYLPRLSEADSEDAFSAGLYGLWLAARGYDSTRGRFSTFAVPKIRGRLMAWIKTKNRKKRQIDNSAISLSLPRYAGEEGATLEDTIPDPRSEFEDRILAADEADRLLAHCSEREGRVVRALGQGLTLDAVGGLEGGVSRERVRQIRDRALQKTKRAIIR